MILITGGAGYIGSQVNKLINENGYNTIIIDNLSTGNKRMVKWGEFVEGDISDENLMDTVFNKYDIECVMHFAANAYVGESIENPNKYYYNNVIKSIKLLGLMLRNNINNIIFSSTCATYGEPKVIPITEEETQNPINPYGMTKMIIEKAIMDYSNGHDINFVILRYFNAAGADSSGIIGELHNPETHLIPKAVRAILKNNPIQVYGNKYKTKDGTAIRDYIHVEDIASAHYLCLQNLLKEKKSSIYNLGNGLGYSVLEIIQSIESISGSNAIIEFKSPRKGDPPMLIGSSNKIENELGWERKYSKLDSIISSAINWESYLMGNDER
jgi:UDP-glucose 4-epimerase